MADMGALRDWCVIHKQTRCRCIRVAKMSVGRRESKHLRMLQKATRRQHLAIFDGPDYTTGRYQVKGK